MRKWKCCTYTQVTVLFSNPCLVWYLLGYFDNHNVKEHSQGHYSSNDSCSDEKEKTVQDVDELAAAHGYYDYNVAQWLLPISVNYHPSKHITLLFNQCDTFMS